MSRNHIFAILMFLTAIGLFLTRNLYLITAGLALIGGGIYLLKPVCLKDNLIRTSVYYDKSKEKDQDNMHLPVD